MRLENDWPVEVIAEYEVGGRRVRSGAMKQGRCTHRWCASEWAACGVSLLALLAFSGAVAAQNETTASETTTAVETTLAVTTIADAQA